MAALVQRLALQLQGRSVEAVTETPEGHSRGLAVMAHPHPLFGGTMDNKVVQTLSRAFLNSGWQVLRFNFRGVGMSAGVFDNGIGEAQDLLALTDQLAPQGPLALAGFSFGAFVACQALQTLWPSGRLEKIILVGTAVLTFPVPALPSQAHDQTLVIHGEQDDTVPLGGVMDWARPQQLPLMVVPGAGHFFHGQLMLLKSLALRHLQA